MEAESIAPILFYNIIAARILPTAVKDTPTGAKPALEVVVEDELLVLLANLDALPLGSEVDCQDVVTTIV